VPGADAAQLTLGSGCSATRPGVAALNVSWQGARRDLGRQRLDITAHKDGFERGLFVTLDRIERGASTRRPAAKNLPVRFFRTALDLTATSVAVVTPGSLRVVLDGVQPGLYYFVRLSTEGPRGRSVGPVVRQPIQPCIVEEDEVQRRRR
jgi:hypothetical protein